MEVKLLDCGLSYYHMIKTACPGPGLLGPPAFTFFLGLSPHSSSLLCRGNWGPSGFRFFGSRLCILNLSMPFRVLWAYQTRGRKCRILALAIASIAILVCIPLSPLYPLLLLGALSAFALPYWLRLPFIVRCSDLRTIKQIWVNEYSVVGREDVHWCTTFIKRVVLYLFRL